jgi:hypothetical protein
MLKTRVVRPRKRLIDSGRVKKGFMCGIDFSPSRAAIAVLGGEIVSMPVMQRIAQ